MALVAFGFLRSSSIASDVGSYEQIDVAAIGFLSSIRPDRQRLFRADHQPLALPRNHFLRRHRGVAEGLRNFLEGFFPLANLPAIDEHVVLIT